MLKGGEWIMSKINLQKLIEDKISALQNELERIQIKEEQSEQKLDFIDHYFKLIDVKKCTKKISLTSFILGSLALIGALGFGALLDGLGYFIGLYLLAGVGVISSIYIKGELKSNYREFLSRSDEDINQEWFACLKEIVQLYVNRVKTSKKIESYETELGKMLEKNLDSTSLDDSKEVESSLLNDFQTEKIDYSNIYFDNSIGENINYTENSKKLIKKR